MLNKLKLYIDKLENNNVSIASYVLSFIFIIFIRSYLESYSTNWSSAITFDTYYHFFLFYISIILSMLYIFKIYFEEKGIDKLLKLVFSFWIIIILPPIIDIILHKGSWVQMAYLVKWDWSLSSLFFSFFWLWKNNWVTTWIKSEILIVLVSSLLYSIIYGGKYIKSFLFVISIYLAFFIYWSLPIMIDILLWFIWFKNWNLIQLLNYIFIINIFLVLIYILKELNNNLFVKILHDLRPERQIHYFIFIVFWFFVASFIKDNQQFTSYFIINIEYLIWLIVSIIILFLWILYSIVTNNIEDIEIDKISNKNRPLINWDIDVIEYKIVWFFSLFLSVIFSISIWFKHFILISMFIWNYYLYSMFPFRFKRIFFLSKIFISFNTLIATYIWYTIIQYNEINFPILLSMFILFWLPFLIQFIDIKDYEGDKSVWIKTLPTVFWLELSKKIIWTLFLLWYIWISLFVWSMVLSIFNLIFWILIFIFIYYFEYNERNIFYTYQISLVFIMIYFYFNPIKFLLLF